MYCEQAEMKLAQYLFDELSEVERIELEAHLDACDACHEKVGDMRITVGLLKDGMVAEPSPVMSEAKRSSLMAQLSEPVALQAPLSTQSPSQSNRNNQKAAPLSFPFPVTPQGRAMLTAACLVFAVLLTSNLMPNTDRNSEERVQYATQFADPSFKDGAAKDGDFDGNVSDQTWFGEHANRNLPNATSGGNKFGHISNLNGVYLDLPNASPATSSFATVAPANRTTTSYDTPLPAVGDLPDVGAAFAVGGETSEKTAHAIQPEDPKRLAMLDDFKSTIPRRYRQDFGTDIQSGDRGGQTAGISSGGRTGEDRSESRKLTTKWQDESLDTLAQRLPSNSQKPGETSYDNSTISKGGSDSVALGPRANSGPMTDDLLKSRSTRWDDQSGKSRSEELASGLHANRPGYEKFTRNGRFGDESRLALGNGQNGNEDFDKKPTSNPLGLSVPKTSPAKDSSPKRDVEMARVTYSRDGRDVNGDFDGGIIVPEARFKHEMKKNSAPVNQPGDDDELEDPSKPGHWAYKVPPKVNSPAEIDGMVPNKLHALGTEDGENNLPDLAARQAHFDSKGNTLFGGKPTDGTPTAGEPAAPGGRHPFAEQEFSARSGKKGRELDVRRTTTGGANDPDQLLRWTKGKDADADGPYDLPTQDSWQGQKEGKEQQGKFGRQDESESRGRRPEIAMQFGKQDEQEAGQEGRREGGEQGKQQGGQQASELSRLSLRPSPKDWSTYRGERESDSKESKADPESVNGSRVAGQHDGYEKRPELLSRLDAINADNSKDQSRNARIEDYENAFRMQRPSDKLNESTRDKDAITNNTKSPMTPGTSGGYGLQSDRYQSTDAKGLKGEHFGLGPENRSREGFENGNASGIQASREMLEGERLFNDSDYLDTTVRTRTAIKELESQNQHLQLALERTNELFDRPAAIVIPTDGVDKSLPNPVKAIELEAANNDLPAIQTTLREQLKTNQAIITSLKTELGEINELKASIPEGILKESEESVPLFAVPKPAIGIRGQVTAAENAGKNTTLAQINIGADAGVKAGQQVILHRNGKYVGTMTVTTVGKQAAAGTLTNSNGTVQAGDGLVFSVVNDGGKKNNGQPISGQSRQPDEADTEPEDDSSLPPSSNFTAGPVNPWTRTEVDKQSTFALDVDTASYTLTRKYIRKGYLPPAGAVRMEEFVNAFDYNYPEKTGQTFTVFATGAPAPFAPANQHNVKLLKVGVRGKVIGRDNLKPAHVVFVVDTSGSMARQDRLPLVKYSLTQLVQQLHQGGEGRPADRVSLVSYGSDVHVLLDRTPASQANQIVAAIDSLQPTGATNLLKGVSTGYSVAQQAFKAGQINRIILCSDGIATLGETEADAMLEHVNHYRKQGISFTSVGFGAGTYNDSLMEKLANKGDGTYIYVDSQREARRVFVDELTSTLQMIAKDAKIQVEFNPHRVHRYRLIGYENRAIADKDFRNDTIDAGEVGSGQSSTALYEVELHGDASASIGTVFVRYKNIDTDKVEEISYALSNDMIDERSPSSDPRFFLAASAAEFAELMRQSEHARDGNLGQLEFTMHQVIQQLPLDQKAKELLDLIKKARTLPRAP